MNEKFWILMIWLAVGVSASLVAAVWVLAIAAIWKLVT